MFDATYLVWMFFVRHYWTRLLKKYIVYSDLQPCGHLYLDLLKYFFWIIRWAHHQIILRSENIFKIKPNLLDCFIFIADCSLGLDFVYYLNSVVFFWIVCRFILSFLFISKYGDYKIVIVQKMVYNISHECFLANCIVNKDVCSNFYSGTKYCFTLSQQSIIG